MKWTTADHHFEHKRTLDADHCNRPFPSVDMMNQAMVARWNQLVMPTDEVFYLGDFSFGKKENMRFYAEMLNGKKYLVRGNHDHSKKVCQEAGFELIENGSLVNNEAGSFILTHRPPTYNDACLRLQASGAGTYWLHGHSHGKSSLKHPRVIDVGVDCWNFYPVPMSLINLGLASVNAAEWLERKEQYGR